MNEEPVGTKHDLNLEDFPKILPPTQEESDELVKRSKAIKGIKDLAANLTKSMESYVFDLQTFDSKIAMLNQREARIKLDELTLNDKEKLVYAREADIKSKEEYLVNLGIEMKEKEAKLTENKLILDKIEIGKIEWEDRKSEAIRRENILENKRKEFSKLETKAKELDERESLVKRSEEIDVERKRLLDIREQRIVDKERRLQIDQNE